MRLVSPEAFMSKQPKESAPPAPSIEGRPKCGIVMPISACDACTEQHWSEVKAIINDAVETVGFSASLVSDADDVGIIQKRIIQNLYDNPIVVCDVSAKNPNVMFELGMRLAFDKPTIIVKDDKTSYSFDTSPIEHLEYPRDLRFSKIVDFKRNLGEKVKATVTRAANDQSYTTFLKHFGKFSVAKLETTEVSKEDFIIEELRELRHIVSRRDMNAERELMQQMEREKLHRRAMETGEPSRRKKALAIIEARLMKHFERHLVEKGAVPAAEMEIFIAKELMGDRELRQFVDSPSELEELLHMSMRRFIA
jgi:hypothetical protein